MSTQKCLFLTVLLSLGVHVLSAQPTSFRDDFSEPVLDPAWSVQSGIGSYSLTANPGFLRYSFAGSTHPSFDNPATWIYRSFSGTNWVLETKVQYNMPSGSGRQLIVRLLLGDLSQRNLNEISWWRDRDIDRNRIMAFFREGGVVSPVSTISPNSADLYFVRISRDENHFAIEVSSDGLAYAQIAQYTYAAAPNSTATVLLSGANFAGSGHADYDYIEVRESNQISCTGFEAPMDQGPVRVRKNRVLPLKMQLHRDGISVTAADIEPPVVEVVFDPGSGAEPIEVDALPAGHSSEGNQFTFDVSEQKWRFNLTTKPYTAAGTYFVAAKAGGGYEISPACMAQFVIQ